MIFKGKTIYLIKSIDHPVKCDRKYSKSPAKQKYSVMQSFMMPKHAIIG